MVEVIGVIGKGAQRWLNLGIVRFQPSEIMKLAVPMLAAWYLHDRPLPPDWRAMLLLAVIIFLPAGLVAMQPDLGTAALIAASGALLVLMAGLSLRIVIVLLLLAVGGCVAGWHFLHDYQRERVLTFLNPQTDPLGAGYHIIQSRSRIGSGGVFGKGWMNGSQAQLEFLPERSTDFIFAVVGEEFGLLGLILLLALYCSSSRARSGSRCRPRTPTRDCWPEHRADLLRLRVHQRRHGERTAAGGGRAAAAGELRRHLGGDAAGRVRYPDGTLFASKAGRLLMRGRGR